MKVICIFTVCCLIGNGQPADQDGSDTASSAVIKLVEDLKKHLPGGELRNRLEVLEKVIKNIDIVIELSPLMNGIFQEAAKKNPELAIALKAIGGQVPDTSDFIHLLTYKHQTIANSLTKAMSDNKKFQLFDQLRTLPDIRTSPRKLATIVKILTGRDVVFHRELVKAMAAGTYTTTKDNAAETGLINVIYYTIDNWDKVINASQFQGSTKDQVDVLQKLSKIGISSLEKVKVVQSDMDNSKYKVGGGGSLVTDPDVISLRGDLEGAEDLGHSQHDKDVAAGRVISVFHDFISLCVHATERYANQEANLKQGLVG